VVIELGDRRTVAPHPGTLRPLGLGVPGELRARQGLDGVCEGIMNEKQLAASPLAKNTSHLDTLLRTEYEIKLLV